MFIKCEKCSRTYEIADEKLDAIAPRFFKCTACGAVFDAPFVQKAEPVQEAENTPKEEVMPLADIFASSTQDDIEEKPEEIKTENQDSINILFDEPDKAAVFEPVVSRKMHLSRLILGAVAFLLTLGCILYLLYVGRFYFVRKVPTSEPLYEKAGITTDITGDGLSFEGTLFELNQAAGSYRLSVKSRLVNAMAFKKEVPNVIILLKDNKGLELQREYVQIGKSEIEAGEKIPFQAMMMDIHPNAAKIEITFEGKLK